MKKNLITRSLLCLFLFTLIYATGSAQSADIILINGKIFTSDTGKLYVNALAIKGNKILATGSNESIRKLASSNTKIIDLKGKTVVPGFNDAHNHVGPNYPASRFDIGNDPLAPTPLALIKDSIARIVKTVAPGTFIISNINPALLEDTVARARALDSVAPHNPVLLMAWTGHGKILNSAALQFFGINSNSSFVGGRVEKYANGQPTGLLEEYAGVWVAAELSNRLDRSFIVRDLKGYYEQSSALGITTMQNMCTQQYAKQLADIYGTEKFPCRVRLIAFPFTDNNVLRLHDWDGLFHQLNNLNYVSGMKLIEDGTPLERLACMRTPYKDKPNYYGRLNFDEAQLKTYMQYCLQHKQQILIHAVGDSSIITVIRLMRSLHPDAFWKDKRVRIEHGDFSIVKPEDIRTLKQLGIVIVQNPLHLQLVPIIATRYESTMTHYLQPMRTLIKNKIPLALGSDGPFNPFLNIMMATLHPNTPTEAITVEEAVIAYTYGSAFAEFKEKEKGTLTKGKLADLAVLSQDIFSIPKEQIPATRSVLTIIDGKIAYRESQ